MSLTAASLYGKGVFTTVAIIQGRPFLWEKHWHRLSANARTIGVDLSEHSESMVVEALATSIERDQIADGRARLTFYDESATAVWPGGVSGTTSLSIITGGPRDMADPYMLTVSPFPVNSRSPLVGVKSCNYLEKLLAIDEVRERGFHEGIRVNESGDITSGCMSNIFWQKGGKLFTPSLSTGCLAGTTREFILENLDCSEVAEAIEALAEAESIFVTSAGIGIVEAGGFDGRRLEKFDHPINVLLRRPQ